MTAREGTRLGRYQIIKHLAAGGMAEVLLANSVGIEGFERHVVIKRIHADQARNAEIVQMFLDEARLAAALHHHNIVQVHDIGQQGGEYFFAMEYVHGEDLRALLHKVSTRRQQVPLDHVVAIVVAAASGLHHAHELRAPDRSPLGLVHRDVSPSNILVGFDGNVKVVDFGIAKVAHRTGQTRSGVLKGKIAYMSPEQCCGKALDRRSDVFALGIVLYELATVRRLFKGDSDFMTMSAIVDGQVPRPSLYRADLPPQLEAIILKALAKSPADRFQTAGEMRLALEQFADGAGLRISASTLSDYMTQLFGHREPPWLRDDAEDDADDDDDAEVSVDFDGSGSGIAQLPVDHVEGFPISQSARKSSPIMKARTKALSSAPPMDDATHADAASSRRATTTLSALLRAAHRPRRRWVLAALVGALAIAATLVLARSSASERTANGAAQTDPAARTEQSAAVAPAAPRGSMTPTSARAPTVPPRPPAPTSPASPPAVPTVATEPVAPPEPKGPTTTPPPDHNDGPRGIEASRDRRGGKRRVKRPPPTQPAKPVRPWDPDSLLPE